MIAEIDFWIGLAASIIATVSLLVSSQFRAFVFSPFRVYGLVFYRRGWTEASLNKKIKNAKGEVSILQTWIPTLNSDISLWESADSRVRFRILLASDVIVQARLKCRPEVSSLIGHNLTRLAEFSDKKDDCVEVRRYKALPFGPIYIIDDSVYWGLYISDTDSLHGPRFKAPRGSYAGKMVCQSFDSIWRSSTTDRVGNRVSSPADTDR